MNDDAVADAVYRAYPMLLALALLSVLVAILTDEAHPLHSVGVILTAFGVFWYLNYEG